MSKIKITINGEERVVPKAISIAKLVEYLELDLKKIAIEKDLEIINPNQFDKIFLTEGNNIEIVHFIGGG